MADTRLVEVFHNGNPDMPALLVMHRDGEPEFDHCPLTPEGVADAALALLRTLRQEDRERAIREAQLDLGDYVGERFIATLRPALPPT